MIAWLVAGGEKNLAQELEPLLLRCENLYTDGAYLAAAELAGAFMYRAAVAGLGTSTTTDNLLYLQAGALGGLGATRRARRLLLSLLERKPPAPFRLPALRKLVDLTLETGDYEPTLRALANQPAAESLADEVTYLKARALLELGRTSQADQALAAVPASSRFRAASLYLRGVLALEAGRPEQAEEHFCAIVDQPGAGVYTYRLSAHAEQLREQAWLALARLRHDAGNWQRALDSYAQIAPGSPLGATARYEAAWSYYRLGRYAATLATLDEAGWDLPDGELWPSAMLLRGYAQLGLCQFAEATQTFTRLQELLGPAGDKKPAISLPLAGAHPRVAAALPETASERRARSLASSIARLLERLSWLSRRWRRTSSATPSRPVAAPALHWRRRFAAQLRLARALNERLARLAGLADKAQEAEISALAGQLRGLSDQVQRQAEGLLGHTLAVTPASSLPAGLPPAVQRYLDLESRQLQELAGRALRLMKQAGRARTAAAASHRARVAEKLASWRKQAAIGRIDAVLGRKQALEIEVENLAQGRYPQSVFEELAASGKLADDVEYWPYDGEGWPDEYEGY